MKNNPQKNLLKVLKKKAGRNHSGRITVRHRGGGVKRKYRLVDFGQTWLGQKVKVIAIEYDPNRTADIALLESDDKKRYYILSPQGLEKGEKLLCQETAPLKAGNRLKLKNFLVGSMVHNVEILPGQGGKMARGAGASCQVMAQEGRYTTLKMPSSETRKILGECFASSGQLSNIEHRFSQIGKAGTARKMGRRPEVRGSVMNACDHPHGGGKNKQPIGMHPKTPWGKIALGGKTRKRKKWSNKLILQRRIKKVRKK